MRNNRTGSHNRVQNPYTIQDSYKDYLEQYPEGTDYYITYNEYRDITTMFFKHIADELVLKSVTFRLPFRLGNITVVKHKPSYKSIKNMTMDWFKSKELNRQVREFNEHSNGYVYRFHWDRKTCILDNKTIYRFQPSRVNKRLVAKLVKTKQNDYFER